MIALWGVDAEGSPGSAALSVNVTAQTSGPPIVTIVNPTRNDLVDPTGSITLKGIAKDPDGKSPISYRWLLKGSPDTVIAQGSAKNNKPFSMTWTPTAQQLPFGCGGYSVTLELQATDADNQVSSDQVQLYVIYPVC